MAHATRLPHVTYLCSGTAPERIQANSHLPPHLDAPSPSHARTQLAIRGVYIFCMGGPTSASRRCRAPRTNSPRELGRSRADPEEAVMIKAVIPD